MNADTTIRHLYISPGHNFFGRHGQPAGTYPAHDVPLVQCRAGYGLAGDRFCGYRPGYKAQVTFFAWETLLAARKKFGAPALSPVVFRRNVITEGLDLDALLERRFTLGGVEFEGAGEARPCHWMNSVVAPGAEDWLMGRGGLRAKILSPSSSVRAVVEKNFQRRGVRGDVVLTREPRAPRPCSAEHPLVGRRGLRDNAGMFLRRKNKKARGVGYSYWHLCETVRTARGPRQRVVASLGKLDTAEVAGLRGGWDDLTALLRGEAPARSPAARTAELPGLESDQSEPPSGAAAPPTPTPRPAPAVQWERADLSGLRVERTRDFGESYLGLALWHRLKLDELLAARLPAGRESVAWSHVAALLTVARFCAQRSELGVAEHWYDTTALDDLLGVDTGLVNDARLYRALDQLGAHKDALCVHLMTRYREWFGVRFEFLLYDVTSTYFEGQAEDNPQAQRGYSRDQRSGNKQVCIGLVCTPEGLPLSFETFAGNRADVTTVEQIVTAMETKYGVAERIWVMDRGMVSEANIAFLRERKARYLVGTPKSWLRQHEAQLLEKSDWQEAQAGLEVRFVAHPDGPPGEKYVLCRSAARAEKERPCSSVRARA